MLDFGKNDEHSNTDLGRLSRYSEILDYHNVDANMAQLEEQLNGQAQAQQ